MGHFMRCFALGQEATRQDWAVYFAGNFSDDARNLLVSKLPDATLNEIDPKSVVDELQQYVRSVTPDVVHLDSYLHELDDFTFEDGVLSNAQDGVFGARKALINIDANLDAEARSDRPESGRALFGIEYAQIRDEVRRLNHEVHPIEVGALKVLVVLGGTDPMGVTPSVVRALAKADVKLALTVVCRESLHDQVKNAFSGKRSLITLRSFISDLPALANEQDFVITTASTSAWDFASMGVPMGAICVADNQLTGYEAILKNELAVSFGNITKEEIDDEVLQAMNIAEKFENRKLFSERGKKIVNGLGVEKIILAWDAELGTC